MRRDPVLSFLAGAAIGAGLMFLLDPDRGPRRRSLTRDRVLSVSRQAAQDLGAKARDLRNRARGLVAGARSRMDADRQDDDVVAEQVRAELSRVVSQPGAVVVAVEHGVVTLSGEATAREREDLISVTRWVRGVRDIEDRLETREPASAPGSQA